MAFAFLNTRLEDRSSRLPVNRLKALSGGASSLEIIEVLREFGIQNTSFSLPDADIMLGEAFKREAEGIANLVKTSKFLRLFSMRFEVFELVDFLTNFNETKIASRIVNRTGPLDFEHGADLKSIVMKINEKFGFKLNQNAGAGTLRDELLSQYLLKLSLNAPRNAKSLIEKERDLVELPHTADFEHFLSEHKENWFYRILKGDPNLIDLRVTFYLYKQSKKLSIQNPLGEMVTLYYIYNLDLNYKFMKALYFSIKKGIKLDFGQVWEV